MSPDAEPHGEHPFVVAHRGASADRPEHTLAAYELAECPGREREAYDKLRAIYLLGEEERLPRVITLINELEAELDIPVAERLAPREEE
jgi:hypothetical protein